jgi:hypothetical protein
VALVFSFALRGTEGAPIATKLLRARTQVPSKLLFVPAAGRDNASLPLMVTPCRTRNLCLERFTTLIRWCPPPSSLGDGGRHTSMRAIYYSRNGFVLSGPLAGYLAKLLLGLPTRFRGNLSGRGQGSTQQTALNQAPKCLMEWIESMM